MDDFREQVKVELRRLYQQVMTLEAYLGVDEELAPTALPKKAAPPKRVVRRKNKPRGRTGPRRLPPLPDDQADKAVALYQGGNGADKIATVLQVNRTQVRRALKDRGVKMRNRADGVRLALALKKKGSEPPQNGNPRKETVRCVGCEQKFKIDALDFQGRCLYCR